MADGRHTNWKLNRNASGSFPEGQAQLGVLMDIRDELEKLNALLNCKNFRDIPFKLDKIRRNTAKPRKPKAE